jgi:hypothetical protein
MSWDSWCSAFISDNQLQLNVVAENQWPSWAKALRDEVGQDVPEPIFFNAWQDWAVAVSVNIE